MTNPKTIEEHEIQFTSQRLVSTEEMKRNKSQDILEWNRVKVMEQFIDLLIKDKSYTIEMIPNDDPLGVLLRARLFIFTKQELEAHIKANYIPKADLSTIVRDARIEVLDDYNNYLIDKYDSIDSPVSNEDYWRMKDDVKEFKELKVKDGLELKG